MNKLILALAALSTLASVSTFSATSASAQSNYSKKPDVTNCDSNIGHLRQVYREQVAGIDDYRRVWVTELCSKFSMLRSEGNAAYLRTTIADNEVLVERLLQKDYHPEDVFAVQMMGDDTINLYVHRFRR